MQRLVRAMSSIGAAVYASLVFNLQPRRIGRQLHVPDMSLLLAYTLLAFLAMLWILKDGETYYIFDVFGESFHYVWFVSGQRWIYLFAYGWRLIALCSFVLLNALLSCRIYADNGFDIGPAAQRALLALMLFVSILPVPWIYVAHRLRCRRNILAIAKRLSGVAERATGDPRLCFELADYETEEPWTAWHPTQGEWKANGLWDGLVPVVYLCNDGDRSAAVFSIDWETFLAWNIPSNCIRKNNDLPVHGPLESSFRVAAAQKLRGCPNWWLVRAEMRTELDTVIEDCG
ncbi:MAG: hypothetical protein KDB14_30270 [Planctomycetales bacterium]|nr:hypothetical protein [Planctomycetales bacterium]